MDFDIQASLAALLSSEVICVGCCGVGHFLAPNAVISGLGSALVSHLVRIFHYLL